MSKDADIAAPSGVAETQPAPRRGVMWVVKTSGYDAYVGVVETFGKPLRIDNVFVLEASRIGDYENVDASAVAKGDFQPGLVIKATLPAMVLMCDYEAFVLTEDAVRRLQAMDVESPLAKPAEGEAW